MACRPPFEGACSRDNCGMEIPMTARRILGAHVAFLLAPGRPLAVLRTTQPGLRRGRVGGPRRSGPGQRLGPRCQRDLAVVGGRYGTGLSTLYNGNTGAKVALT